MAVITVVTDSDRHVIDVIRTNAEGAREQITEAYTAYSFFSALRRRNPLGLLMGDLDRFNAELAVHISARLSDEQKRIFVRMIGESDPADIIQFQQRDEVLSIVIKVAPNAPDGGRPTYKPVTFYIDP